MTLVAVLLEVILVVASLLVVAMAAIVGRRRIRATVRSLRDRIAATAEPLALLAVALILNALVRDAGIELSWLLGVNVTGVIYGVENGFVAILQSFASPPLTAYFAAAYVYGYAFLLVFPLVAYAFLAESTHLRETAIAYVVNYGLGLACYLLFIAYGPRNLMPEAVDSLLYETYPRFQFLTSEVNTNTNVFPSLHASLSATAAILAYRTREIYPRWFPVATFLAASVSLSTMYLGIHWATDVVAGFALAGIAVWVATHPRFD